MPLYDEELSKKQALVAATPDMLAQRAAIMRKLALILGEQVLEVGSGNGQFVHEMSEAVRNNGYVVGIDAAPAMIPLAQAAHPQHEFLLADATDLPFRDCKFDAVTSAQVLSYVNDIEAALAQIHRVLKPGGRLVVLDTDWHSIAWEHSSLQLMRRAIDLALSVYADAHLSATLAEKLHMTGFQDIERQLHPITNHAFTPDSYSYQMANFIEPAMRKSPLFTQEEADHWVNGLRKLDEARSYTFTVNRVIFTARK